MATSLIQAIAVPIVLLVGYFAIPFDGHRWPIGAAFGVIATLGVVPLAVRGITRIRTSERPVADALRAISLIASLAIVGFSISYFALATSTDQFPDIETKIDALYFTVVTTGTVGYGDLAPTGQGARALVSLHIVLNLTLIGAVLRVVTRAAGLRREQQTGGPPAQQAG